MSASGKTLAAFFAREHSRATPTDMLPERKTGIFFAASAMAASSSGVWPVVAITTGSFRSTA